MKTTFKLGSLTIDATEYGSQGNAILGIRDSGKTYTATYFAERLFEAGVPFISFDPIGVWRFLRVPKGKGYPIVVAGGKEGDLPLTVAGAPEIVRAAMHNGVSLVIDLFDIKLSKADWRRIVKDSVRVLLHENSSHGLRHVFLEEAAEFIPQKVLDGDVYAELEKLARMGGNSRLGYTLINQRSQEVNKAVLELCENLFLHRQKGKNSLENMSKWLDVADVTDQREIIKSLPGLPQGECWAWLGGDKPMPPTLVKVPEKNSLHPDRRVMRGDKDAKPKNAVDVGSFVASMKGTLVAVEEEAKANDPKLLRAEIAALKKQMADAMSSKAVTDPDAVKKAEERGFEQARKKLTSAAEREARAKLIAALENLRGVVAPVAAALETAIKEARKETIEAKVEYAPPPAAARPAVPRASSPVQARSPAGDGNIERPQQLIIDAIRWLNVLGVRAPSHAQAAFVAGYSHKSGTWSTYLSRLRSSGLIEGRGDLALTEDGLSAANNPDTQPTGEQLRTTVLDKLDAPLKRILGPVLDAHPFGLSHQQASEAAGYSAQSGTWSTYLSRLRSLDLIEGRGELKAQGWLFP